MSAILKKRPEADVSWHFEAACHDQDPEKFFPPDQGYVKFDWEPARAVCNACPVLQKCRDHALSLPERHGMFGGLTPSERNELVDYDPVPSDDDLVEAYVSGASLLDTSIRFGVSRTKVVAALDAAGVQRRPVNTPTLTPEQDAKAAQWRDRGESWEQIAKWLKCDAKTARRAVGRARTQVAA